MSFVFGVKLFASPTLIGFASLAGKRWGHTAAGIVGGLPLVGGPIVLALWLSDGAEAARSVALAAPVGIWATIVYLLAVGFLSALVPWYLAIPAGWICYAIAELGLHGAGAAYSLAAGLAVIPGLLIAATRWIPKPKAAATAAHLPRVELLVRMVAAAALVLALTTFSNQLGFEYTGMLSAAPVAASVIPAFVFANAGRDALLLALRGFLTGLNGFAVFFLVLGASMTPLGMLAAVPALVAALAASLLAMRVVSWAAHARA